MKEARTTTACTACPRHCSGDRSRRAGFCGATDTMEVAALCLHRGEEPVISGTRGSGTVFFSHCNLKCVYCQNHDISHKGAGTGYTAESLAARLCDLEQQGAHNINFVSPAHYAPHLPALIRAARAQGLTVPIVYNTNAYDDGAALRALEGLVDIYLPDIKYGDNAWAVRYSQCDDYTERSREAITEMFRQVGPLVINDAGIARRGLLVRHLVLPHDRAGSNACLDFLAGLSCDIPISIMAQYHPCYRANEYPELARNITVQEYEAVLSAAEARGFSHIFAQELESSGHYLPDFSDPEHPFE